MCVLYFSPQVLTWSKLPTSLVALLEALKFHNSPIKLTMLWGAFAVRGLFDLMCSTQHKPGLENVAPVLPVVAMLEGFSLPLCRAWTQTFPRLLLLLKRAPLGWAVPRCPAEPVQMQTPAATSPRAAAQL